MDQYKPTCSLSQKIKDRVIDAEKNDRLHNVSHFEVIDADKRRWVSWFCEPRTITKEGDYATLLCETPNTSLLPLPMATITHMMVRNVSIKLRNRENHPPLELIYNTVCFSVQLGICPAGAGPLHLPQRRWRPPGGTPPIDHS